MNDRYAKWGAATGFLAVVLFLVGFLGFIAPGVPDFDSPGSAWVSYFSEHQSRIQFGVVLIGIALLAFLWFLGSVRSALARAEGGEGRLTSIAFGAGLISIAMLTVGVSATAVAALRAGESGIDPNLVRAFQDLSVAVGGPGAAAFTAFFTAVAIVGYRFKAVPAPVAGFAALAAITQPLAYGVAVTDSGAFAGDGVIGGFLPIITFTIGVLALSIALFRRPEGYASASAKA